MELYKTLGLEREKQKKGRKEKVLSFERT